MWSMLRKCNTSLVRKRTFPIILEIQPNYIYMAIRKQ